jgi:hypothetical protein
VCSKSRRSKGKGKVNVLFWSSESSVVVHPSHGDQSASAQPRLLAVGAVPQSLGHVGTGVRWIWYSVPVYVVACPRCPPVQDRNVL